MLTTPKKKEPLIDYNVKNFDGRSSRLSKIIKESKVLTSRQLEKYADYILESGDIESGRKVEYSYFVTEKEMRKYKEFSAQLEKDNEEYSGLDYMDAKGILSKNKNIEDAITILNYCVLHFDTMEIKEKKNLVSQLKSVNLLELDSYTSNNLEIFIEELKARASDEIDTDVISMFMHGSTEREIAEMLGLSISTVNRRLGKML